MTVQRLLTTCPVSTLLFEWSLIIAEPTSLTSLVREVSLLHGGNSGPLGSLVPGWVPDLVKREKQVHDGNLGQILIGVSRQMLDLIFVAATIAFFLIAIAYVRGCESCDRSISMSLENCSELK